MHSFTQCVLTYSWVTPSRSNRLPRRSTLLPNPRASTRNNILDLQAPMGHPSPQRPPPPAHTSSALQKSPNRLHRDTQASLYERNVLQAGLKSSSHCYLQFMSRASIPSFRRLEPFIFQLHAYRRVMF